MLLWMVMCLASCVPRRLYMLEPEVVEQAVEFLAADFGGVGGESKDCTGLLDTSWWWRWWTCNCHKPCAFLLSLFPGFGPLGGEGAGVRRLPKTRTVILTEGILTILSPLLSLFLGHFFHYPWTCDLMNGLQLGRLLFIAMALLAYYNSLPPFTPHCVGEISDLGLGTHNFNILRASWNVWL
uniref:Uncharacterized protein n=2 Tax=Micrurus TaxID=8634 RepID=A0A2D4JVT1_9SAUR